MSKKSKKKQLHNQLEDLFNDLEQDADLKSLSTEKTSSGWVWEINKDKVYTDCGQGIERVLGYQPLVLLNQSILDFAVAEKSRAALQKAFQAETYPTQTEVIFISTKGARISISLNIFANTDDNGEITGWHGFAEQIDTQPKQETFTPPAIVSVHTGALSLEDIPTIEPDREQPTQEEVSADKPDTQPLPAWELEEDQEEILEPASEEPVLAEPPSDDMPDTKTLPAWELEDDQEEIVELPSEEPVLAEPSDDKPDTKTLPAWELEEDDADEFVEPVIEKPVLEELSSDDEQDTKTLPDLELEDEEADEFVEPTAEELVLADASLEDKPDTKTLPAWELDEDTEDFAEPIVEKSVLEAPPPDDKPDTKTLQALELMELEEEIDDLVAEEPALETKAAKDEPFTKPLPDLELEDLEEELNELIVEEADRETQAPQDEPLTKPLPDLELDPEKEIAELDAEQPISELTSTQDEPITKPLPDSSEEKTTPRKSSPPITRPRPQIEKTDHDLPVIKTPIQVQQGTKALLEIVDDQPDRVWTEDEILLVQQVADQLSLALENAELFQQTQSALAETDMLYQASAELNAANNFNDVITVMHRHTIAGNSSILTAINIFDTPWETGSAPEWIQVVHRTTILPLSKFRTMHKFTNIVGITRLLNKFEPTIIEDVNNDLDILDESRETIINLNNAKSAIFLPITVGGIWYGFFDIYFQEPNNFQEHEIRRLSSLAIQAAEKTITIQLNRSEEIRRRNSDRLSQIARQVAEILSQDELISMTTNLLFDFINPDQISIFRWMRADRKFSLVQRLLRVPDHAEDEYIIGDHINPEDRMDLSAVFENNSPYYQINNLSPEIIQEHYILPWVVGDRTEGIVEIYKAGRDPEISETDREFVLGLLLQIASAIERARLFEQTQAALAITDNQAKRLRLLNELGEELTQVTTLQEAFDLAVQKTHQIFMSDRVSLTLITPDRKSVEIAAALETEGNLIPGTQFPLEGSANQVAIEENRTIITPETPSTNLGDIRSFMIGPLFVSGEVIGTLNIGSVIPNTYTENDEDFMNQLLSTIGSVVENRRLFLAIQDALSDSEEQARRLSILNEMSDLLTQANTAQQIFKITASYTVKIVGSKRASITMLTHEADKMDIVAVEGDIESGKLGEKTEMVGGLETAIKENRLVFNPNLEQEDGTITSTMVAPLTVDGTAAGTINIMQEGQNSLTDRDQNVMLQISNLASRILENNRLFTQIQKRSVQLETGATVSQVASTLLDMNELISQVVELIKEGFGLYYCGLFLVDEDGKWTGEPNKWAVLRAGTGEAGMAMLAADHKLEIGGTSMIGTAVSNAEARIALDVGEEAIFFRNPYLPDTRSEMAIPLMSRNTVLGALSIQSTEEAYFTNEDITALRTMGDQVANAIENARLFEQTETRAEELAVLNEMARSFTQTLDVDTIIDNTFDYTARLMNAENFYLAIYDPDQETIEFKLFIENNKRILAPKPRLKLGAGLTDWIIKNAMPILMPDKVHNHLKVLGIESRGQLSESWLGVPLMIGSQVIGVIGVQSYTTPRTYGNHELDLLSAVANQAAIAIDNATRFQEARGRARREQVLREVTAKVHSSADAETILRTAVREISSALGRQTFITMGDASLEQRDTNILPSASKANGNGKKNSLPPLGENSQPEEEE